MQDLDKTAELISISLIEFIINDSNTFCKFIRQPNDSIFLNIDPETIVASIDNYMEYVIKNSTNLTKDTFDRVNYLNQYYRTGVSYDFETYLEKTSPLVNIEYLQSILSDEQIFHKFLNFDENKEYFEFDLSTYLSAFNDMIRYYDNMNIVISNIEKDRFIEIMKHYSLNLKKLHTLTGYKYEEDLSDELIETVLKNVDLSEDKFTIARAIYLELCKFVTYDVTFGAFNQKIDNEVARNIYEKKPSDINYDDNKVVCKTWAEIYQALLSRVGIDATVDGNFHKYVLLNCDGTLLKADATNSFISVSGNFSMNDITRVQLGLETAGFVCVEQYKDITIPLQESDEKIKYYKQSIENQIKSLEASYCTVKVQADNAEMLAHERLKKLISISNSTSLVGFELNKYTSLLARNFFSGVETDVRWYHICKKKNDEEYNGAMLFLIQKEDDYQYIIYNKELGTFFLTKEELSSSIENREIVIIGKNVKIPGIMEEENEYKSTSRNK